MYIDERRKKPRSPLHSKGSAILDGARIKLKTHDVSLAGSLVEFEYPPDLEKGSNIDIRLDIGFVAKARISRISRNVNGKLVFGLAFDRLYFSRDLAHPLH
ncbi:MAG: PilZ domain-containing protein [Burkholderiales bacterium]